MTKYIDANRLWAQIDKIEEEARKVRVSGTDKEAIGADSKVKLCLKLKSLIDSLQQEQQDDLASLINEATNVAKRIVDRNSFYNSLPQNLRYKYTSEAWCEILEALSIMKEQEQPEVDFKIEERKWIHNAVDNVFPEDGDFMSEVDFRKILKDTARHFYEFGELNARKED